MIEGLRPGKAYIKAMAESNRSIFSECEITVKEGAAPILTSLYTYENYSSDYGSETIAHIDSCPASGKPKLLIIPIWFNDSDKYINSDKKNMVISDISTAYFGNSLNTGWESVASFYQKESKGKCAITGKVASWFECGRNSSYYNSMSRTTALVKEATTNFFNTTKENSQDYDTNRDGYLDGVVLIYGAPDFQQQEADSTITSNKNLWGYCQWVQERVVSTSNPIPNTYFWASYDFMYDSARALSRSGTPFGGGSCKNVFLDTHTFIHEAGHLFGLEDYYCYNSVSYPAGAFSMQDFNVGGHDPFSMFALGWINPYIPTSSCEITLSPFQDGNHQTILLTPQWNSYSSVFDEYLLLEFYTPTGLNKLDVDYRYTSNSPQGVNKYGIRLWHVDARLTYNKYKEGNQWVYSTELINSPEQYTKNANTFGIRTAMSNTYYLEGTDNFNEYCSPLGSDYYKYNILELIRKSSPYPDKTKMPFNDSTLFVSGDQFVMSSSSQFKNDGLLNSGKELGFTFKVKSITTGEKPEAVIQITKL